MTISKEMIKELREKTGAGFLACREALEKCNGDLDKAVILLREQGLAAAAKRADRETANGILDLYNHGDGRVGVMIEVNCETDFVARTQEFRFFAHELALQVAANFPEWIRVEDVPEQVIEQKQEEARKLARQDGKPEKVTAKIVEGRLRKFLDEKCLLRQPYIRDDSRTVEELLKEIIVTTGENIVVRRFARWTVGEDLT